MEKVNVMEKIALFTHRVARPIKFAAFVSIIVSVAVMFVACQGAVGKAGADGADGADGTDGPTGPRGPQGEPGVTPLTAKGSIPAILVNDPDPGPGEVAGATVGPVPAVHSASDYFIGGGTTVTYSLATAPTIAATSVFTVAVSDGMVTIGKRTPAPQTVPAHYTTGTQFVLDAMDISTGVVVPSQTISVKRNRRPVKTSDITADATAAIIVGTQAGFPVAITTMAAKGWICNSLDTVCTVITKSAERDSSNTHFADDTPTGITPSLTLVPSVPAASQGFITASIAKLGVDGDDDNEPDPETAPVDQLVITGVKAAVSATGVPMTKSVISQNKR